MSKPQYQKNDDSVFYGEKMRILLNSDLISEGEISNLLKSKGVVPINYKKPNTVPLLSSMILSSTEFNFLTEKIINREQAPKIRKSEYDLCDQNLNWTEETLDLSFTPLIEKVKDKYPLVNFTSKPKITIDKHNVEMSIAYEIERKDMSKDFLFQELKYEGFINVKKVDNDIKIKTDATHTSKETEYINQQLLKLLAKHLKDKNIFESEEPRKILFKDFNNQERIIFLKRLSQSINDNFQLGKIIDILLTIDKNEPNFPEAKEISWLNKAINSLRIDGDELNDLIIINNNDFLNFFIVQDINISYDFKISTNSGNVKINYYFDGIPKKNIDEHELTFTMFISHSERPNETAKKEINKVLNGYVDQLIEKHFNFILNSRKKGLTETKESIVIEKNIKPLGKTMPTNQISFFEEDLDA
ncbi:hypothetical protein [Acinetobacter calcoaceticus]|uniref:hypothetical protein n=1 Tax=Acinetobacter calcoaceticus TaxID=471 RepID=UPI00124F8394|nr:hypothetical protein [Acinetobacter calcoaceticus]